MNETSPRPWLSTTVLAVALVHALFYAAVMPPWNINEAQHLDYVLALKDRHRPPHILERLRSDVLDAVWRSEAWKAYRLARPNTPEAAVGRGGRSFEGYQPPLYYLLMLPMATLAGGDPLHAMYAIRVASAVLLVLLVGLTGMLAARWFLGEGDLVPAGAALSIAAIPVAVSACARVTNDGLVAVLIGAGVVSVAALLDDPSVGRSVAAGTIAAAAVLTKSPGVLLVPVILVALAILARRGQLSSGVALTALGPAIVAYLAWAGVTYARYGVPEGTWAFREAYAPGFQPLSSIRFLLRLGLYAWVPTPAQYFAERGVAQVGMTAVLTTLVLVGGVGILRAPRPTVAIVMTGVLLGSLGTLLWIANLTSVVPPVGRVLIPAYPLFAALTAAGWARLMGNRAALVPAIITWAVILPFEVMWVVPFLDPGVLRP